MAVIANVIVAVIDPVAVAALVNRNDVVILIDTVSGYELARP